MTPILIAALAWRGAAHPRCQHAIAAAARDVPVRPQCPFSSVAAMACWDGPYPWLDAVNAAHRRRPLARER